MSNKKVLVIMDPIESIDISKDTTYQLMCSAQDIGHDVYYLLPNTLSVNSFGSFGSIGKLKIKKEKKQFYKIIDTKIEQLSNFDYILMRKDPPVDINYIYQTYLLDLVNSKQTKIINPGSSLRNFNEKLITLNFPSHIPDTIVTSNKEQVENFKKKHKKIILKPLNLMGGRSIYMLEENDKNLNVIFEDMTNMGRDPIIAQQYLEEAKDGDKRIIIINGEVIRESVIRIPNKNDHRSNLASGGSIKKYLLDKDELKICKKVATFLKKENIQFAGLDMIGNKITEINITSPTCVAEINKFHNINLGKYFWKKLND